MDLGRSCACFPNGEGRHPLFLYMAVTNEQGIAEGVRVPAFLGVSSNPPKRIIQLNGTATSPPTNRIAKKGAPYWILELVIGPFADGARQLAVDWANKSRKVACRIVFAVQMVCRINDLLKTNPTDQALLESVKCIPARREGVVVWARDKHRIHTLMNNSKAKPRKRPREDE